MNREKLNSMAPWAIFGLLILVLIAGLHHHRGFDAGKFAKQAGDPAPATDLPILHGEGARFTTASWHGRPYIVNFFASWCPDCKAEHEELMTLAAAHMPLIGIIFKDEDDRVGAYLDHAGNPFLAVVQDRDETAKSDWGLAGVPETFIVDAGGVIRWHHAGVLTDAIVSDELMPLWEQVAQDKNED